VQLPTGVLENVNMTICLSNPVSCGETDPSGDIVYDKDICPITVNDEPGGKNFGCSCILPFSYEISIKHIFVRFGFENQVG